MPARENATVAMRLDSVTKRFPGVVALDDVSFDVVPGEVHALVGENGAGKSTLMSVAAGSTLPEEGGVEIGGRRLDPFSPSRARELGLAIVHQHPALLPDLNVLENLLLAVDPKDRPPLRKASRWARERLSRVGFEGDLHRRVGELSVADRHLLEIAKALATEPGVLVLDEPTEPLLAPEIERLFELVAGLVRDGAAVVYISHRLPEVQRIADRITVLRDGRTEGTFAAAGVSEAEILARIVGRPVDTAFPDKAPGDGGSPVLSVSDLTGERFRGVSFDVAPGEIVGLAGVEGNGQRDILRALAGIGKVRGEVCVDGRSRRLGSPSRSRASGFAYLPADRHEEGLMLSLSVQENAGLLSLDRHSRGGVVSRSAESAEVAAMNSDLAVKAPSLAAPVSTLSGGNQQKIVLGRALLSEPRVLLADEPTQGVDLGARLEIYRVLRRRADEGVAVVVVSSDAVELAGLCDRVLVFSRGQVVAELRDERLDEHAITESALTSTSLRHRGFGSSGWSQRLRRLFSSDLGPSGILGVAILALGAVTASHSDRFLSAGNITSLLLLLAAIAFISLGQLVVLMIGAIDLSVGPLSGFLVVVASFFVTQGASGLDVFEALALMFLAAILVGALNALMATRLKMGAVIATLVTYIVLQGLSLLLRETPDGYIDSSLTAAIKTQIGGIPIAIIVVVALAVALELALRRTRWGIELRAVGSSQEAAHALGVNVARTQFLAFVLCSVLVFAGAVMLMAQIGVGDASAGVAYTLSSITAVVLGGASIFGGRGSFIGVLLGAALIQEVLNATTFLALGQEWQLWLLGGLTIVAAAIYSRGRGAAEA